MPTPTLSRWLTALLSAWLLLSPLTLTGCASSSSRDDAYTIAKGPEERLQDYRAVARSLREHPEALAQGPDLDLADTWITRADRMITDADHDQEHLALMLDAIEGQLVMVRTSLTRRDAERRLEAERADYASRSGEINTLRQDNDAALRDREDATTKETP